MIRVSGAHGPESDRLKAAVRRPLTAVSRGGSITSGAAGVVTCSGGAARDGLSDIDAAFAIPIDIEHARSGRKLTDDDVREIRASKRSTNALAREFHVDPKTVRLTRRGETHSGILS